MAVSSLFRPCHQVSRELPRTDGSMESRNTYNGEKNSRAERWPRHRDFALVQTRQEALYGIFVAFGVKVPRAYVYRALKWVILDEVGSRILELGA